MLVTQEQLHSITSTSWSKPSTQDGITKCPKSEFLIDSSKKKRMKGLNEAEQSTVIFSQSDSKFKKQRSFVVTLFIPMSECRFFHHLLQCMVLWWMDGIQCPRTTWVIFCKVLKVEYAFLRVIGMHGTQAKTAQGMYQNLSDWTGIHEWG